MSWIPIGPFLVFGPKDVNYLRISRRNEFTANGIIWYIAIEPNNKNTLYVSSRPNTGGAAAFRLDRTPNGKEQFIPISDFLQQTSTTFPQGHPNADPSCIAIHPQNPQIIFMGVYFDRGIYVSTRKGDEGSWLSKRNSPGVVKKIIVDPRPVNHNRPFNENNTALYISTDTGIYKSENGGRAWIQPPSLPGNITAFVAHFPTTGEAQFYAGVAGQGVYHRTDSQMGWTQINFDPSLNVTVGTIYIDYCHFRPSRIYVINTTTNPSGGEMSNLYTCQLPGLLTEVISSSMPILWSYDPLFAVSPNSPGDGINDILFAGAYGIYRSTNSGRTWVDQNIDHTDYHAIAFFPSDPAVPRPGETPIIPEVYIGNDGGLFLSTSLANISFNADRNGYHNHLESYDLTSGDYQNLDHGRQGSASIKYACHPTLPSIGYLGHQDTGIAAHKGSLVWRRINNNDAYQIACAPGENGVKIWCYYGSPFNLRMWTDRGGFVESWVWCYFGSTGKGMICSSITLIVNNARQCIAGIRVKESNGTYTTPCVVRIRQDGIAEQLSQIFQNNVDVTVVRSHPLNDDIIYCVVKEGNNNYSIYKTNQGTIAFGDPRWQMWQQVGTLSSEPTSITIDRSGNVYILLRNSMTTGIGSHQIRSPLYKITTNGRLEHQRCRDNPDDVSIFEKWPTAVSDPVHENILYVSHRSSVYKLTFDSATSIWRWESISASLPGPPIFDIWIANISSIPNQPKLLLRAAVTTRGVWELDLDPRSSATGINLYVRHNILDTGYLDESPEGAPNPYNPMERVWHYQSPDIKIDMQKEIPSSGLPFYQTDPEATPFPIDHIDFGRLKDNSQNLLHTKNANVFVQVHNHTNRSANEINVWILFTRASAGVPSLPDNFWSQFNQNGRIIPNLSILSASLWRQIDGASPFQINEIKASSPKVANWNWIIPRLDPSDLGHYCMVAFIHSRESPIIDTISDLRASDQLNVDLISRRSRQVAQKNLHILPSLIPQGSNSSAQSGIDTSSLDATMDTGLSMVKDYIEFHNPEKSERIASLIFDFSTLPNQIHISIQFSKLKTSKEVSESIAGISKIVKSGNDEKFVKEDGTNIYFSNDVFYAFPSKRVEIKDVIIPSNDFLSAFLRISNEGILEEGSEYAFDVLQTEKEEVVGGSTFLVTIAGKQKNTPISQEGDLDPEKELKEQEHFNALPPDLREMTIARLSNSGITTKT